MTKLISWNVNGLRACVGKGFLDFFREAEADVFCIQESKLQEGQIELDLPGYHQYCCSQNQNLSCSFSSSTASSSMFSSCFHTEFLPIPAINGPKVDFTAIFKCLPLLQDIWLQS